MPLVDKKDFAKFTARHDGGLFQSTDWANLQQILQRPVYYLINGDNAGLFIQHSLPGGQKYWYAPRGPIVDNSAKLSDFIADLKNQAARQHVAFCRFEPTFNWPRFFGRRTNDVHPAQTAILDLGPDIDKLSSSFHAKTRYNIKLAQKKGLTVRTLQHPQDLEIFWQLLKKTYDRQAVKTHPKSYYFKIFEGHYQSFKPQLYIAEYQKNPIAANIVYFFGDTAIYAHGGADYNYRQLMAPHLLQWQQIIDAKNSGCRQYDFWGYDEKKWPGVSRFKQGFNPKIVKYPGTFDLPVSVSLYQLYRLAKFIRRLSRGL